MLDLVEGFKYTQKDLRGRFAYHPDGYFIHKKTTKIGKKLNKIERASAYVVYVGSYISYQRAIFLWHYGIVPRRVTCRNGDSADFRIENLKPSYKELLKHKIWGARGEFINGVYPDRSAVYCTHIAVFGHSINNMVLLGYYMNADDARMAYNNIAIGSYGKQARIIAPGETKPPVA